MLRFINESDARRIWKKPIDEEIHPKSLVSDAKMIEYFFEVLKWSTPSKTAKSVVSVVQNSDVRINVIGIKGGFSAFVPHCPKGQGTIFYDIKQKMVIEFTSTGPEDIATKVPLDKATGNRIVPMPATELHNYIGFLHEMGHAKQFIETQEIFTSADMGKLKAEIEKAARDRGGFWADMAKKRPQPVAPPIPKQAPAMVAAPSLAPEGEEASQPPPPPPPPLPADLKGESHDPYRLIGHKYECKPVWGVRIESDNLLKHEWPICEEMGYPKRNYKDLKIKKKWFPFW